MPRRLAERVLKCRKLLCEHGIEARLVPRCVLQGRRRAHAAGLRVRAAISAIAVGPLRAISAFARGTAFALTTIVGTALAIVAAYFLRRKPAQLGETAGAKLR